MYEYTKYLIQGSIFILLISVFAVFVNLSSVDYSKKRNSTQIEQYSPTQLPEQAEYRVNEEIPEIQKITKTKRPDMTKLNR